MGEFDLIAKYFKRPARDAALGVGDDCALLLPTPGTHLAVSCDMLVEGRHFLSTVAPERLGHKALAVNLSDLAACGATPRAFTLALALPRPDEAWLAGFAECVDVDQLRHRTAVALLWLAPGPLRTGHPQGDGAMSRALEAAEAFVAS